MKEKFKNINPDNLIIPSKQQQPQQVIDSTPTTANDIKNEKKKIKRMLKKAHKDEAAAVIGEVGGGGGALDLNKIKDLTNQIIVKIPYEDHTYALSASSLNLLESLSSTITTTDCHHNHEISGVEKRAKKKSKILGNLN